MMGTARQHFDAELGQYHKQTIDRIRTATDFSTKSASLPGGIYKLGRAALAYERAHRATGDVGYLAAGAELAAAVLKRMTIEAHGYKWLPWSSPDDAVNAGLVEVQYLKFAAGFAWLCNDADLDLLMTFAGRYGDGGLKPVAGSIDKHLKWSDTYLAHHVRCDDAQSLDHAAFGWSAVMKPYAWRITTSHLAGEWFYRVDCPLVVEPTPGRPEWDTSSDTSHGTAIALSAHLHARYRSSVEASGRAGLLRGTWRWMRRVATPEDPGAVAHFMDGRTLDEKTRDNFVPNVAIGWLDVADPAAAVAYANGVLWSSMDPSSPWHRPGPYNDHEVEGRLNLLSLLMLHEQKPGR